jgi:SpoVK/Ycf46/Vps4 family AAA+-type ATPase
MSNKSLTPSDRLLRDLAAHAVRGATPDVERLLRDAVRENASLPAELRTALVALLHRPPTAAHPIPGALSDLMPQDDESRLDLLEVTFPSSSAREPILPEATRQMLVQIDREYHAVDRLGAVGLAPARTVLFHGPPGVGKTMAARWLAARLDLPLLTLDLATVISSFLGKSGTNVRAALEYAAKAPAVLLLDEFDAVAKRRADDMEIGELKRLVTVLLQSLDRWPEGRLLIAATNHADLLDPAIWRRFDMHVAFPVPGEMERLALLREHLPSALHEHATLLARVAIDTSAHDLLRRVDTAYRRAVVDGTDVAHSIFQEWRAEIHDCPRADRPFVICEFGRLGYTQTATEELSGWNRATIRRYLPPRLRHARGRPATAR